MKRNSTLSWLLFLPVLLLVAGICLPVHNSNARRSTITVELDRLGYIWIALRSYAEDHDGKFPGDLSDPDLASLQPFVHQFHNPATGAPSDWLYFPGHTMHDPPNTVLIAFPVPVVEREWLVRQVEYRGFTSIDAPIEYLPEAEFQQRTIPLRQHP